MTINEDLAPGEKVVNDILEHHGIRGMKWGVRRSRDSSASGSHVGNTSNLVVSEDHARAVAVRTKIKTGGTKSVSNKELQELVTRLNLEQQHTRLISEHGSTLKKGQARVKQILGFGKTAQEIHSFINSPLTIAIKAALKSE